MPTSPLTLNNNVRLIDTVEAALLIRRYRSMFHVDTTALFKGVDRLGVYRCEESGLVFFDPPVCGDGPFYEKLQELDWYYQDEKNEFALARPFFPAGGRVLEIGCGGGAFLSSLSGMTVEGIEFNDRAIDRARARGLSVEKKTMRELIEAGAAYDVVCSFQVLEHVAEPRTFLEECRALVRPGGLVVAGVPSLKSFATMPGVNQLLNLPPHHVTWWGPETFQWLGRQSGWKVVDCIEEELQEEHVVPCAETAIYNVISRAGGRGKLVFVPHAREPLRMIARVLAPLAAKCLRDPRLRPRGLAMVAVLENVG